MQIFSPFKLSLSLRKLYQEIMVYQSRGPQLATINTQENITLCHYVISVHKTLDVDIKMLTLAIEGS